MFTFSTVKDNLGKMQDYLDTCEPESINDLYVQLMKGVEALEVKLCDDSDFQDSKWCV